MVGDATQMMAIRILFSALTLLFVGCDPAAAPTVTIVAEPCCPPIANIDVTISGVPRSPMLFDIAAQATARIGADSAEGRTLLPPGTTDVHITFRGPHPSGQARFLHASYRVAELRSAVSNGIAGDTLLLRSTDVGTWTPSNHDIVSERCPDQSTGLCALLD